MTQYLIALAAGIAAGYLLALIGATYQQSHDLQHLIDLEATKRKADGIHRKGDTLTETEPVESGVIRTRELAQ